MQDVNALIRLLDDPDEGVYAQIESVLKQYGKAVLPFLDTAGKTARGRLHRARIVNLSRKIQQVESREQLRQWVSGEHRNLLRGAHLVSQISGFQGDMDKLEAGIESLRKDAWLEFNENLTALEKIRILNYIFFDLHGYKVSPPPFHTAGEHCIHKVLRSRSGSPVIMAILYSVLAQRLDMPVHGISLPGQYILAYLDGDTFVPGRNRPSEVLFYINVFNMGSVFSAHEIRKYLRKMNIKPDPGHFFPASNIMAVHELLRSLEFSYETTGQKEEAEELRITRENLLNPAAGSATA